MSTVTVTQDPTRGSIGEFIPSLINERGSMNVMPESSTSSGSSPAILWASQWRTTGGPLTNAVQDSGSGGLRWDYRQGSGGSVITAASTGISGWPTTNVLTVPVATGSNWCKPNVTTLPVLGIGATRYFRWYMAATHDPIDTPGSTVPGDNQCHPVETSTFTGYDQEYGIGQWFRDNAGTVIQPDYWGLSILCSGEVHFKEQTGPAWNAPIVLLPQYTVYRIEMAITRINTTQYTVQARRYLSSSLVAEADENDFYNNGNVLAGYVQTFDNPAMENATTTWSAGTNQSDYMPTGSASGSYQAAFAISDEGWLGPYNAATEANWDA